MQDLNTCHISPTSGNIITAKGKLFYAQYLYQPQKDDSGKDRYSMQLVFKPETDLKMIKNELGRVALEALKGDATRAKNLVNNLFTDPLNPPRGGKAADPKFAGWVKMTAASKQMPDFVHPNGQKVDPATLVNECYSGRWARATIRAYYQGEGKYQGLRIGLTNIQLLDHDEPIGFVKARGEEEFGDVTGGQGATPTNATNAALADSLF